MVDGYEFDQLNLYNFLNGTKYNKVPIIIGTNLNEASLFFCMFTSAEITRSETVELM